MNSLTKTTGRFTQRREANEERPQWRWTLESDQNDEPLSMSSEGYNNKADAIHCFVVTTGAQIFQETGKAVRYCLDEEDNLLRDEIEIVWEPLADA